MGRKGGERLLNALLVADICQDMTKHRDLASLLGWNHQTAHSHQVQKADRFQCHGLAASVRSRDDQAVKILAQGNIGGHHLVFIDQRMPGADEGNPSLFIDLWYCRFHPVCQMRLCKNQVQLHGILVALNGGISERACLCGEFQQDTLNFLLLVRPEYPDFVIGLHNAHRFDENGGAAGGGIMHQSGNLSPKLRLYRYHIPPAALCDNAFLQMLLMGSGMNQLVQLFPHPVRSISNFSADRSQGWGRCIGDLFFIHNASEDLVLQIFVRRQNLKTAGKSVFHTLVLAVPLGKRTDCPQCFRHIQKFSQPQSAACLGTAQGIGYIFHSIERWSPKFSCKNIGGIRLLQQLLRLSSRMHRRNQRGLLCRIGTGCLLSQHLQYFVEFQSSVILIHCLSVSSFLRTANTAESLCHT